MTQRIKQLTNKLRSKNFGPSKYRVILIILTNLILVAALVSCLFMYYSDNSEQSRQQNENNIESVATAKSQLANRVLFSLGESLSFIANYCDGRTVDDTMACMSEILGDSDVEYQLITKTRTTPSIEYTGLSTQKYTSGDHVGEYKTVTYAEGNFSRFIDRLEAYTGGVAFSTEFSSASTGAKSYATFCGLTLIDKHGQPVEYQLMRMQSVASLLNMLKLPSQYKNLSTAIIDHDGNYLVSDAAFKALNFYDYIYKFNDMPYENKDAIMRSVQNDSDGVGLLHFNNSRTAVCTFVYSRFADSTDWYIVVFVPESDYVIKSGVSPYVLAIILILTALLVVDILQVSLINKKLRVSADNEKSANRAKSEFLSRMSHDMRTPLNSIINFSDFIEDTTKLEDAKNYGRKVSKSGKYLLTLINDTLAMSRIETGHLSINPEPLAFADFESGLLSVLGDKATRSGIKLTIEKVGSNDIRLLLDPLRLQEVFVNLLNNAIKFTAPGGEVSLKVFEEPLPDCKMNLRFEVADNGRGMSKEFLENKLFKAFSQETHDGQIAESGTGLGLSIAKSIIEEMGGTISCQSELGVGTTFTVIVPCDVSKFDNQTPKVRDEDLKIDLNGRRVLLCEDNDLNREITQHLLAKVNCEVETVSDGKQGITAFENSEPNHYDAILMDKHMPVMDGIEATRIIRAMEREDAKTIPIIALSADVFDEHIEVGIKSGMTAYLTKPVVPALLYRELYDRILANHGNDSAE